MEDDIDLDLLSKLKQFSGVPSHQQTKEMCEVAYKLVVTVESKHNKHVNHLGHKICSILKIES